MNRVDVVFEDGKVLATVFSDAALANAMRDVCIKIVEGAENSQRSVRAEHLNYEMPAQYEDTEHGSASSDALIYDFHQRGGFVVGSIHAWGSPGPRLLGDIDAEGKYVFFAQIERGNDHRECITALDGVPYQVMAEKIAFVQQKLEEAEPAEA